MSIYTQFIQQIKTSPQNQPYQSLVKTLLEHPPMQKYITSSLNDKQVIQSPQSFVPWMLFFQILLKPQDSWCFVCPNEQISNVLHGEVSFLLSLFCSQKSKFHLEHLIETRIPTFTHAMPTIEHQIKRARFFSNLSSNSVKPWKIITSIQALTKKALVPKHYQQQLHLKVGEEYSIQQIIDFLHNLKYTKVDIVHKHGEYSAKGNILDIFVYTEEYPIRADFWGNEIESIRVFSPITQLSVKNISFYTLGINTDILFSKKEHAQAIKTYLQKHSALEQIPLFQIEHNNLEGLWDYFPLFFETINTIDYIPENTPFILYQPTDTMQKLQHLYSEYQFSFEKHNVGVYNDIYSLFSKPEYIHKRIISHTSIIGITQTKTDVSLELYQNSKYSGRISLWLESLQAKNRHLKTLYIMTREDIQKKRIQHILQNYSLKNINLHYLIGELSAGFTFGTTCFITEDEVLYKKAHTQTKKYKTEIIESFVDLKHGDFIVHLNHGIGKFITFKSMIVLNKKRDFIELEFSEQSKIYLPLEQIQLIHKYIGSEKSPTLDHLGKKSKWSTKKQKATESAEKTAQELLEIHSKREKSTGFPFPSDTLFQEEFEASFPYYETTDQEEAIYAVKQDMESKKPMDRLICGDVGFGKTEVAIRASFKAVMAGKQVALLCPTTILAFQHFSTFSKRFQDYPINVDYISRFRTNKEIQKTLKKLKDGTVDVVIGTHALLSSKVSFKQLALLIIDEEQKFGVMHKEKVKTMKFNLDCITMTATPIPRTLQMSLIGLRDLSLIQTPPENRKKIETYVLTENDEILREAIKKEIKRNGQIYILHNNIKTIEAQARRFKNIYPKAKIAILHGQLPENEVEDTLIQFYEYQIDILISTTIIESGIDIPNVNTLLVLNAHTFGLSQLYQIKGRIGRSDRQGFAYFFYPAGVSISEIATKRLNALQEYDELGDGFKIAMQDLEIRGSGNILGKEQSGDIIQVGFEMYTKLLQRSIAKLKNENLDIVECNIQIIMDEYIPTEYIADSTQKMEIYKKLASKESIQEIILLQEELHDRFGAPPPIVQNLCEKHQIRVLSNQLFLHSLTENSKEHYWELKISYKSQIKPEALAYLVQNQQVQLKANEKKVLQILYDQNKPTDHEKLQVLKEILTFLQIEKEQSV